MYLRLLAATILTAITLSSCQEKSEERECRGIVYHIENDISDYRFIIRDADGNNMLDSSAPKSLDIERLKITTTSLCNSPGKLHDTLENGMLRLVLHAGPPGTRNCTTAYLQWDDTDTDTLYYDYDIYNEHCLTRYTMTNFRFNGQEVKPDTGYSSTAKKVYILQK